MQAIIVLAIFGFMAAVVGGFVAQTAETTQVLIARQQQAQQDNFHDIALVATQRLTATNYEMPGSNTVSIPAAYLCARPELRQLVTCRSIGGTDQAVDQWGNPLRGYMTRVTKSIYAHGATGSSNTGNNNTGVFTVNVPVTAMVLVSAGSDGRLDDRLNTALAQLPSAGGDPLRNILGITAYKEATGNNSKDSLDDLVVAFSDQAAQEKTLAGLQANLNRVATAALRNYQNQFRQFAPQLAGVYDGQFDKGTIDVAASMQRWRSAAGVPSFSGLNTATDPNAIRKFGTDAEIAAIERASNSGGATGSMKLNANYQGDGTAGVDASGASLYLWLSQAGTMPWSTPASNCGATPTPVNCIRVTF